MNEVAPVFVMAIITFGTYRIFELFVRRNERMAIIEKLSTGLDPRVLMNQFKLPMYNNNNSWPIRIGLLLLGIGLGVVIATIVDLSLSSSFRGDDAHIFDRTISILYFACAALFGGLGLVIAYFIEDKKKEKNR